MPMRYALTFAALSAALLLAGCGDNTPEVAGAPVSDVESALEDAERQMRTTATTENANLSSDARCYLSYATEDAEQISDLLRCGPVLFEDSHPDEPWMLFSAGVTPDQTNPDAQILQVGVITDRSTRLSATERLWRPDGAEPPDPLDIEVPLPPPVEPTFISGVDASSLAAVTLSAPTDPQLRGFEHDITIEGRATINILRTDENLLVAPDGYELHVLDWSPRGSGTTEALAVSVDGANRPLEYGVSPVVFAAPAGASVELYLRDSQGTEHRYDLIAGEVTESPSVFYRTTPSQDVNETFSFPFALLTSDGVLFDGTYPIRVQAERFTLSHRHPRFPDRAPADGRAWLLLDASSSGGNAWYAPISADRFVLHLPDGEAVPGTAFLPASGEATRFLSYQPAWEVPEDFEEGMLRISPGRSNNANGVFSSYVLDWGDLTVEIPVQIPNN